MKKTDGALGVGVMTIFTVLLVLCLSVLAMLAFTSAQAEQRLAKVNAENVSAYYAADIKAHRLYEAFVESDADGLQETIPVSGRQSLQLWLERENGQVQIRAWNTITEESPDDSYLELWDGTLDTMEGQP